jgi:hypothetical protein
VVRRAGADRTSPADPTSLTRRLGLEPIASRVRTDAGTYDVFTKL